MKKYIILVVLLILFIVSIINEPLMDTIDAFTGATNSSYGPSPDSVAGASYEEDDEEEDDE